MIADATRSNPQSEHRGSKYRRVQDARKRPIRGLWQRNERFYARLKSEDVAGRLAVRWFPLFSDDAKEQPCKSVAEAVAAFEDLKSARRKGKLAKVGQTPLFADYVDDYFKHHNAVSEARKQKGLPPEKRASTLGRERGSLNLWKDHLAGVRLHKIRRQHIQAFIDKRQQAGMTGGTGNYDVIALRNVLKRALKAGLIAELPTKGVERLDYAPAKRGLVTADEIDRLCTKAMEVSKNGQQFSDYVRLMCYCGSRREETLRLTWNDVDWQRRQLTIGSDGLAKNGLARCVDFNAKLEAHLRDMQTRRAPDTEWLFPSPNRGSEDIPVESFRKTLEAARKVANLPDFGCHDCRHFFASMAVMSGVDFMTIAEWLGHQDGGILIGQVYGHLNPEHKQRMAAQVNFGPVVVEKAAAQ
jgi:integrase